MKLFEQYKAPGRLGSAIIQFFIMFAFWVILSGRFEAKYLILGVLSSAFVTWLTSEGFFSVFHQGETNISGIGRMLAQIWRFIRFVPWMVWQIIVANFQVAYYVLHPKMPIDPEFLLFKTEMKKSISLVALANSITVTPGTITATMSKGKYTVHVLKKPLAGLLEEGIMQEKVGRVFGEEKEPPPKTHTVRSIKEVTQWIRSSR